MKVVKRVKGYVRSIYQLRKTRLEMERLQDKILKMEQDKLKEAPAGSPGLDQSTLNLIAKNQLVDTFIIGTMGARNADKHFSPAEVFAAMPDMQKVLTNGLSKDIDGGVNENLKTVLRTPHISQRFVGDADMCLISVMRPEQEQFWKCVSHAFHANSPLYYAETSFFGGYASYFDDTVSSAYKKSLGYVIDDMGYYFDSRLPSRLETMLNDPFWELTPAQKERSRSLIAAVVENKITKYNRYVGRDRSSAYVDDGIVLVVDQKRNDASIRLGGADNGTFDKMLASALAESDGRRVYVKAHPDNLFEKGGWRYSPGAGYHLIDDDVSISEAMEKADIVYTVSSQVGFEALLRGKKVIVFGLPFYAGWGLTDDRRTVPRRLRRRGIEEIFHAACVELSVYVDPNRGCLTSMENTIDRLLWMRSQP